jgi:hypothetical protein
MPISSCFFPLLKGNPPFTRPVKDFSDNGKKDEGGLPRPA